MADATPELEERARGRAPTHVPTARCDSGAAWIADYDTSRNDMPWRLAKEGQARRPAPTPASTAAPTRLPPHVATALRDSGGSRTAQLHTTLAPSDAEAPVAA